MNEEHDHEYPKPVGNGYALVDWRLSRIEQALAENASSSVPIGIYNVSQQVITEKLAELTRLYGIEQATREKNDIAVHARIDAAQEREEMNRIAIESGRKKFWLTVAAGILVAVINLFGNPIAQIIAGLMSHK